MVIQGDNHIFQRIFGWVFVGPTGTFWGTTLGDIFDAFSGPFWEAFWGAFWGAILDTFLEAFWEPCGAATEPCGAATQPPETPRAPEAPRTSPRSSPEAFRGSQATRLTLILTRWVLSSHATGPGSVPAGCGHPCWHENWCPCAQSWLQGNRLCLVRHQEFGCI